jgi:signal peptidase I
MSDLEQPSEAVEDRLQTDPEAQVVQYLTSASPYETDQLIRDRDAAAFSLFRQTVEFMIFLIMGIMVVRTFAAEAYIVPTGSMAPTLLGLHKEVVCNNCRFTYVVGSDEMGRTGRPVCPNCGQVSTEAAATLVSSGDRLLVQKFLFDVRPPRRWEVAVFQSRNEPNQAYVKRVVGLPGEAVQVKGGDLYINNKIERKSLVELRAMRQLVYDNEYIPEDSNRFPRFVFRRGRERTTSPSGWKSEGTGFRHEPTEGGESVIDWLDYRHWDSDSGRYGNVRDYNSYNGGDLRCDHTISDLMLDAKVSLRPTARDLVIRISTMGEIVHVTLPVDGNSRPEVRRNSRAMTIKNPSAILLSSSAEAPRYVHVEVAVVDRRLIVALDGQNAFDPIDFDSVMASSTPFATPISLGVRGGGVSLSSIKIYRDVYYTSSLAGTPQIPFGVTDPYLLGPNEFFVLGDNSPVSNDSRFWESSPVVKRGDFLGKPFLVHLPGQLFSLKVFGRSICWIPDPREIRYIR